MLTRSTCRHEQAFFDGLAADAATKENMEKRTKLRTLCETRWTSRADALCIFKTAFPVVVHALERLQNLGDDKAGQHLASLMPIFSFVAASAASPSKKACNRLAE
jgi:hypothetical protein